MAGQSIPWCEPSRELPLSLTPPNGASSVEIAPALSDHAVFQAFGNTKDSRGVPGEEIRSETERAVVCRGDHLVFAVEAEDRRAERLFVRKIHPVVRISNDCRVEECAALRVTAPASRSASAKTMKGALPPSSSATFFTVPAHCRINSFPTSVEPVKLTTRTAGWEVSTEPIATASPVTILTTPAGNPARCASSLRASAVSGRLRRRLHHDSEAGGKRWRNLWVIIAAGKFQGVIAATTSIGCRMTRILASLRWLGSISPAIRLASSP